MKKILLSDLSESTVELINSTLCSYKQPSINYEFKRLENEWINQYNVIKAEGWPIVRSYNDFENLPDGIKKECIEKLKNDMK